MKILHLTYHHGCSDNIKFISKQFNYDLTTQFADWNYNIGHDRAIEIWEKYKNYFYQFDVIITSDTCPLSRIFLQNNYTGKLIIWVCNRFDYADAASNDCDFPDNEYYDLIRQATFKSNVKIFSYTKFEYEYAQNFKNVNFGTNTIKPCCSFIEENELINSEFPASINKNEIFFIPPYHNDTILNIKNKCDELNIASYNGRYNGPQDLKNIKGIIHIPYAWSNLALFENWHMGNVYLIPTARFLFELQPQVHFFWSPPFPHAFINSSEWYLPEHRDLFIYFDNWTELQRSANNLELLSDKREKVLQFEKKHTSEILIKWQNAIERWN